MYNCCAHWNYRRSSSGHSTANEIVYFICSAEMTKTNTITGVSCKDGSDRGSYVHGNIE